MYSPPIGDEFLIHMESLGIYKSGTLAEYRRTVRMLNDMLSLGFIRKSSRVPIQYPMDGPIGADMRKFMHNLEKQRLASKTVLHYRRNLSYFLDFLSSGRNLSSADQIREDDIVAYMKVCTNKASAISNIKKLLEFWHKSGIITTDFEEFFSGFKIRVKERIPSFYSEREVQQIELSINRDSSIGKRDYAMVLLASRLGLRASDIATLTFAEIDWTNNVITKVMKKTGSCIELPLLPEVGNAIIDYLKNGRPHSSYNEIFLKNQTPYTPLEPHGVSSKINRAITDSGVSTAGRHHGPHSLRHSLASALLDMETPIETISEVLGHKNFEPTMRYLCIDEKSLSKCSLEIPQVPKSFYEQKGGVFYERL